MMRFSVSFERICRRRRLLRTRRLSWSSVKDGQTETGRQSPSFNLTYPWYAGSLVYCFTQFISIGSTKGSYQAVVGHQYGPPGQATSTGHPVEPPLCAISMSHKYGPLVCTISMGH